MLIDIFLVTGGLYLGFLLVSSVLVADVNRLSYQPKHKKKSLLDRFEV